MFCAPTLQSMGAQPVRWGSTAGGVEATAEVIQLNNDIIDVLTLVAQGECHLTGGGEVGGLVENLVIHPVENGGGEGLVGVDTIAVDGDDTGCIIAKRFRHATLEKTIYLWGGVHKESFTAGEGHTSSGTDGPIGCPIELGAVLDQQRGRLILGGVRHIFCILMGVGGVHNIVGVDNLVAIVEHQIVDIILCHGGTVLSREVSNLVNRGCSVSAGNEAESHQSCKESSEQFFH